MRILVAGGAGYIGSHMVKLLVECGHDVTTFDNLSNGHRDAVVGGSFFEGDLADPQAVDECFQQAGGFGGVIHFASFIQVGESVREPGRYYLNNVANTINLLEAMRRHGVQALIFSSTAAIFGEPARVPMDESHPQNPINPYGRSKLMVEQMLRDYEHAHGIRSVALRYFNAAGADPDGKLGERHNPETHLIPLVLQAASGRRQSITVHGSDYDTPDGTCLRDYIHVCDLCSAHLLALQKLRAGAPTTAYNLGNGNGFSVREVIDVAQEVTGKVIPVDYGVRRAGDPARLVADSRRAKAELGWQPCRSDLATIVRDAWAWESMSQDRRADLADASS